MTCQHHCTVQLGCLAVTASWLAEQVSGAAANVMLLLAVLQGLRRL
jgi:hypothetical protein